MRVNGSIGPSRTFKESLPHGSVPSHLLFTIYINDLLGEFEDAFVSDYADDLLISRNKDMMLASLQPEVCKVFTWSDKANLTLNTSKCETAFFRLECAEAAWQPNITIDGKRMFCNPFPIFWRVMYDRRFIFRKHVKKLCQSMSGRIKFHQAMEGTTWGWHTFVYRQVYITIVRSMLEYVAAA